MAKRSKAAPSSAAKDLAAPKQNVYGRSDQKVLDDEIHLRIFKSEQSPNWYVQFPLPTKRQFKKSLNTKSKKAAVHRAWKEYNDFQEGRSEATKAGPKVREAVESFLKNKQRLGRATSSISEYGRTLEQFCVYCDSQGVARLGHFTQRWMEKFEDKLRTEGIALPKDRKVRGRQPGPNSASTVHEKIKLVKSLFKFVVNRQMMLENPIQGYELPQDGEPNVHCYTSKEVQAICAHAEPFFTDVFMFLACTGLRQGELRWATKQDVDVAARLLHIRKKAFPKEGLSWNPKGDDRVVPLGHQAMEIASKMLASDDCSRWLFPAPPAPNVRDDHLRACRLEIQLRRAKLAAGVEKGTLHSFRHFFVSTMANANVSPFKVMKMVGHRSLEIILGYYHVGGSELVAAVEGVDFATILSSNNDQK